MPRDLLFYGDSFPWSSKLLRLLDARIPLEPRGERELAVEEEYAEEEGAQATDISSSLGVDF